MNTSPPRNLRVLSSSRFCCLSKMRLHSARSQCQPIKLILATVGTGVRQRRFQPRRSRGEIIGFVAERRDVAGDEQQLGTGRNPAESLHLIETSLCIGGRAFGDEHAKKSDGFGHEAVDGQGRSVADDRRNQVGPRPRGRIGELNLKVSGVVFGFAAECAYDAFVPDDHTVNGARLAEIDGQPVRAAGRETRNSTYPANPVQDPDRVRPICH